MPHDLLHHSKVFGLLVDFNSSSMAKAVQRLVGSLDDVNYSGLNISPVFSPSSKGDLREKIALDETSAVEQSMILME